MSAEILRFLLPEIVLVVTAVGIYLAGAFVDARRIWSWIAGGGLVVAAVALGSQPGVVVASGPITIDELSLFARWLALALGAMLVLLASRPLDTPGTPEYLGSLLLTIAGMMLAAGAGDLVLLFVGLELISIPTYILLYLGRRDSASQEAAAKYFFLSILASAMLLYGFSFLYGTTGSTQLAAIRAGLADPGTLPAGFPRLVTLAVVLVFAGLGFKIAVVPLHFYAPDVYQGTTHANAALLSVVPKAAGLVVLVRIMAGLPVGAATHVSAWQIAGLLAVATMTLGNVMALWQDHLRRLLAYSSIAHAGYMLLGLAVGLAAADAPSKWDGLGAMLFYLCVYAVATLGTFAALAYLGRSDRQLDTVDELAGLGRSRPIAAAAVAVFMFSLAGIPPLVGFWGKLVVFGSALSTGLGNGAAAQRQVWFVTLAVVGILNAAVAAAYYLRIVGVMYFRTPLATPKAQGGRGPWAAAALGALLAVALGLYPWPLVGVSNRAAQEFRERQGTASENQVARRPAPKP
jgi:NADH-quinone oxidoreductase subunit N